MANNLFNIEEQLDKDREFIIKDNSNKDFFRKLIIHFNSPENLKEFNETYNFSLTQKTKSFWYNRKASHNVSLFSINSEIIDSSLNTKKKQYIWPDYNFMPEYVSADCTPFHSVYFYFSTKQDFDYFIDMTNFKVTEKTVYVYYPESEKVISQLEYVWTTDLDIQPNFPIYIISKGRWNNSFTAKNLMWMNIKNFYITVEEQEWQNYVDSLRPFFNKFSCYNGDKIENHILKLDKSFQENYETVDPEGDKLNLPVGSGAARNFNWWHASTNGYKYHWTMDDNIFGFYRLNNNRTYRVKSGAFFKAMEDFVLQHENIVMAGPQYTMFIPNKEFRRPLEWNTRVYSCNLIKTDLNDHNGNPIRWRCRYNEDTDLSLRILKEGYSTCLFVPFLQDKAVTQSVKGGNTDSIYNIGTEVKSKALARLHPDVTEVVIKYNRVHHQVNYNRFKNNNPKRKPEYSDKDYTVNNMNLELVFTGDTTNICRKE